VQGPRRDGVVNRGLPDLQRAAGDEIVAAAAAVVAPPEPAKKSPFEKLPDKMRGNVDANGNLVFTWAAVGTDPQALFDYNCLGLDEIAWLADTTRLVLNPFPSPRGWIPWKALLATVCWLPFVLWGLTLGGPLSLAVGITIVIPLWWVACPKKEDPTELAGNPSDDAPGYVDTRSRRQHVSAITTPRTLYHVVITPQPLAQTEDVRGVLRRRADIGGAASPATMSLTRLFVDPISGGILAAPYKNYVEDIDLRVALTSFQPSVGDLTLEAKFNVLAANREQSVNVREASPVKGIDYYWTHLAMNAHTNCRHMEATKHLNPRAVPWTHGFYTAM